MAAAQVLKAAHAVDDAGRVRGVADIALQAADGVDRIERSWSPNCIHTGYAGSIIVTGNQLRQDLHRWLSPPDPSTNHNIASSAHHEGTATWFFNGSTYKEWKSVGSESLLWVHGKRAPLSNSAARYGPNNISYS
jgi:hypothetical protein